MSESANGEVVGECANSDGSFYAYSIMCPACQTLHLFDKRWTFNGDKVKPTFRASMLVKWDHADPPVTPENLEEWKRNPWPQKTVHGVCHSFVTDGKIEFLGDCTHAMKGQTVPLPKISEW